MSTPFTAVLPPPAVAALEAVKVVDPPAEAAKPAPEAAKPAPEAAKPVKRPSVAERLAAVSAGKPDPAKEEVKPVAAAEPNPDADPEVEKEIEETTKNWAPGEKKAFTKKTYELRSLKRTVSELEAKIAERDAKGKDTVALEAKLAEAESKLTIATDTKPFEEKVTAAEQRAKDAETARAALEQELQVAAVERSQEFKNAVTKPKAAIEDSVRALAKKHEINERTLLNALAGTDEEQAAAVEGLSGPEQTKFFSMALRTAELDAKAEVLRVNAAEANVKIQARRESETKAQFETRKAEFAAAHKQNWSELVEALPFLNPAVGTDEVSTTWNSAITSAQTKSAATDFATLPPAEQSQLLQRGYALPLVVGALKSEQTGHEATKAALATAEAELTKFRANKPGAETDVKDDQPAKPDPTTAKMGMPERIAARIAALGKK